MNSILLFLLVVTFSWALIERSGRLYWQNVATEMREKLLNSGQANSRAGLKIALVMMGFMILLYFVG